MDKKEIAPGPGWKHLGASVWENTDKVRICVGGMVRLPDHTFFHINNGDNDGWYYIKMNGGNRKRGLMAWANCLFRRHRDKEQ